MHDISLSRGTGAAATQLSLKVFDKLWDKGTRKFVVLGTTKWAEIPASRGKIAKFREQDLQKFWKDVGGREWAVQRVDDEDTSPWTLVKTVLLKNKSSKFQDRSRKAQFANLQGNHIIL